MLKKSGVIVSNKMMKTLVVRVDTNKVDSKYHKSYKDSKNYYVDVENEKDYNEGDSVMFVSSRPISKLKKWKIVKNKEV